MISCNNQTLYNSRIAHNRHDLNNQNNAKENFDELPERTAKKHKTASNPILNNKVQNVNNNVPVVKTVASDDISAKEVAEDESCYELKKSRDNIYR